MADAKTMGIFELMKRGLKGVFKAPGAVFLGVGAEVSGAIFSIGFEIVFGAFMYVWIARAVSALLTVFFGFASPGEPGAVISNPVRFLAPLAVAAAAAVVIVFFMKVLWAGAAVRGTVKNLMKALPAEGEIAAAIQPPALLDEEEQQTQTRASPEEAPPENPQDRFYAFQEGISAFPKILPVAAVFLPIAAAVFFVCATIVTMTVMMLFNLMRDGIGSKTIPLTLLALILGGSIFFLVTRCTAFLFRLSTVRTIALNEPPLQAVAASVGQFAGKFRLFLPIFMGFGCLKFFAMAGNQFSGSIWGGVGNGGMPRIILAIVIYVAASLLEAALAACITSSEYGTLTAAVLAEAGLIVPEASDCGAAEKAKAETVKTEAPPEGEEPILETNLVGSRPAPNADEASCRAGKFSKSDEIIVETVLAAGESCAAPPPGSEASSAEESGAASGDGSQSGSAESGSEAENGDFSQILETNLVGSRPDQNTAEAPLRNGKSSEDDEPIVESVLVADESGRTPLCTEASPAEEGGAAAGDDSTPAGADLDSAEETDHSPAEGKDLISTWTAASASLARDESVKTQSSSVLGEADDAGLPRESSESPADEPLNSSADARSESDLTNEMRCEPAADIPASPGEKPALDSFDQKIIFTSTGVSSGQNQENEALKKTLSCDAKNFSPDSDAASKSAEPFSGCLEGTSAAGDPQQNSASETSFHKPEER